MRKSRLVWRKQKRLIERFIAGPTARTAASLVGVDKMAVSDYFLRLRQRIDEHSDEAGFFEGEVELDERYFGGQRKGKQGRGAAGKVPVFGLLRCSGKVYAVMIPNAKAATVLPIIREKVKPDSILHTDGFKVYNALDLSGFRHDRMNRSECFVEQPNHSHGIENFWNQAKHHLRKFNGIPRDHFHLSLKEYAWRFNNNDPLVQLSPLIQWVKQEMD